MDVELAPDDVIMPADAVAGGARVGGVNSDDTDPKPDTPPPATAMGVEPATC